MSLKLKYLAIVLPALILVGCTSTSTIGNNTGSNSQGNSSASFTAAQVATHNNASDCWTIISGNVYNITSYVGQHPGGNEILRACGTDATALFTGTDPSGRRHSGVAENILSTMQVGTLAS